LNGPCAIVSTFRLRQEFYGLPTNASLLAARLEKECVHELGHTLGIQHCVNYERVMASSHAIELLDLKMRSFCSECRGRVLDIRK
jgi:archaemetzincin